MSLKHLDLPREATQNIGMKVRRAHVERLRELAKLHDMTVEACLDVVLAHGIGETECRDLRDLSEVRSILPSREAAPQSTEILTGIVPCRICKRSVPAAVYDLHESNCRYAAGLS